MRSELHAIDPEEWARVHDERARGHFVFRRARDLAVQWITDVAHESDAWLDAGCGTGHLTAALSSEDLRVIGVDRSAAMIRYAAGRWARSGARFADGDADSLPFRSGIFDGVVAISLIGCIAEAQNFFSECARVLKPGGVLCLSATNRHSVPLALIGVGRRLRAPSGGLQRYATYDPGAIVDALQRAGFEIQRQRFYGRFGLPATWTQRFERDVEPGARSIFASNLLMLARLEEKNQSSRPRH